MSLTRGSAQLCQRPVFHRFLQSLTRGQVDNPEQAAAALRHQLQIQSRRELDANQQAADRYRQLIRQFNEWMNRNRT